jgi:hypothetical protein
MLFRDNQHEKDDESKGLGAFSSFGAFGKKRRGNS